MMSDSTFVNDREASDSDKANAVHDNGMMNENTNPENILGKDNAEEWEQELDSTLASNTEIHDWKMLHDQIQNNLRAGQKASLLSCINQLLILSNFTTLRLKGASHMVPV